MPAPAFLPLWPFRPAERITERLAWLTDVIGAEGLARVEQRIAHRTRPRRTWESAWLLSDDERRLAENLLHGLDASDADDLYLPVWMDSTALATAHSAGAGAISVTTQYLGYTAGGKAALIAPTEPAAHEIVTIDTVEADEITLTGTLAATWPAGTLVMPAEPVQVEASNLSGLRWTGADLTIRIRFRATAPQSYAAASETSYRGFPVLTERHAWDEDLEQAIERAWRVMDPHAGARYREDTAGGPLLTQAQRWTLIGRAAIDQYRQWLYARRGRYTAFWQPSWAQDLRVVAAIGSSDTTIDVAHCGYTDHVWPSPLGRRDLRIETVSGTVYYRRVTGASEVSASVERLTIDSALGATVPVASLAVVSWMQLSRLDADAVELAWWDWQTVESRTLSRGIRNAI